MTALDVDGAIANVKTMLSGLSAWQTICGVATSALAAERIYEYGVEEDDEVTLCPCIILDVDETRSTWTAGALRGNLIVTVRMELAIPEENRTSYSTQGRWFWQKLSAMLAGINGGVGDSGELMLEEITMPLKPGRIDDDHNGGRVEWMVMLGLGITLQ